MKQPLIESCDFGSIKVGEVFYTSDIIITPEKVVKDWWRLEGHRLQLPDVRDYLLEDVDAVVIGTGYYGMMRVDDEVIEAFKKRGREVIIRKSMEAVKTYNKLVKEGKKAMLFIHLTC